MQNIEHGPTESIKVAGEEEKAKTNNEGKGKRTNKEAWENLK